MLALGPRSRGALVAGALVAFALAYATTPIVARGASAPLVPDAAPLAAAPAPTPFVAVLPRRDPFASAPGAPGANAASGPASLAAGAIPRLPPPSALSSLPALPAIPGLIGPLPPNAGAGRGLPPLGSALGVARVTAIVSGAHPYALVEERDTTRVVAPGDAVAGERVVAIDAAGVHLAHGTSLPVTPADGSLLSSPPPSPSPKGPS